MSGYDLRIRRREAARRRCSSGREKARPSRLTEVLYKAYRKSHGLPPIIFGRPAYTQQSELIRAISANRLDRKRWTRYLATGEGPLPKGWFGPFKAVPSPLDIQHRTDPLTSAGRLWMMQSMQLRRGHVVTKVKLLEGGHLTTRESITFLDTNGITWEITGGGRVTGSDRNRASAIRGLFWKRPGMWIVDDYVDASERAGGFLMRAAWNGPGGAKPDAAGAGEATGDLARSRIITISQSKIDRLELLSADGKKFDLTSVLAGDITMQMAELPRPANLRLAKIEAWSGAQDVAGDDEVSKTWRQVEREPLTARGLERAIELVEAAETYPARLALALARVEAARASVARHAPATP